MPYIYIEHVIQQFTIVCDCTARQEIIVEWHLANNRLLSPPSNLVTPLPSLSASACVSLGFLFSLLYACRAVFSSSRPPAHSFPVAFFFIFKKVGGGGWAGEKKERPLNFKNWKPKIVFIYFNKIKSRQRDEGDFFFFALQLLVFFKWNKAEINNPDALIDK